mmetsp:Transcript_21016/g.68006  ORF Transcript_21016/g.68006 Transcript_21016/m.68006 type:complete len:356 (-) Transcript_21016:987-2054(-)
MRSDFPLEIPVLQLMGALYMGNKPLLKVSSQVSVVMEQFLRLLHSCGLPREDVDFVQCSGAKMHELLLKAQPRTTLFTGSSTVADLLARDLHGKVKVEDAGFDWKILGPDVSNPEYVAHVCDQDSNACSGQKCSAQSILFMHDNWAAPEIGFENMLKNLAESRSLEDLTVGPTLTVTNEQLQAHIDALLRVPGARLVYGGSPLDKASHSIPSVYGSFEPTAVHVPLDALLRPDVFRLATKEMFAPFQVITTFSDAQRDQVLSVLESMEAHLTAAVVSDDVAFLQHMLAHTVNGTTYAGLRARTTGAPQNHWFGPAGDPRGAGIGTPEAIQLVWSCHREIVYDHGPIQGWSLPQRT